MTTLTDIGGVVGGSEDELGSSVVARTNVRDVGLALYQVLGAAKVAQFEDARFRVEQQILRLYVPVADTQ